MRARLNHVHERASPQTPHCSAQTQRARGYVTCSVRQEGASWTASNPCLLGSQLTAGDVLVRSGVTAFWAGSPNTEGGDVRTHWYTEGGENLLFKKGESRCILISSGAGPINKMYARFRQCDAKVCRRTPPTLL